MKKEDTLLSALSTVLTLQRWNFLPRIETWTEAENAVYVTHVGYALGRSSGMRTPSLLSFIHRNLLKSLSKHFTTDIPVPIREKIVKRGASAWSQLIDDTASRTGSLFPRSLSTRVQDYITSKPSYHIQTADKSVAKEIEGLIEYAHNRVASEECTINEKAFTSEYGGILNNIEQRILAIDGHEKLSVIYENMSGYFIAIKGLKYLRRWNRLNRVVNTSVLAHTYLVTLLAVMICWLEEDRIKRLEGVDDWTDFQYKVALRALFHDLPESFTGDLITPLKNRLSAIDKDLWPSLEAELTKEFHELADDPVRKDIAELGLLEELDASAPFTVDSLVKDCDRLALVLECVYERDSGRLNAEMLEAYESYVPELQRSEWRAVREFVGSVAAMMSQK